MSIVVVVSIVIMVVFMVWDHSDVGVGIVNKNYYKYRKNYYK